MIGEQHKRINLERRRGPARVDRPAEQRPSPVLTKESCAAIGYERKEKRAAGSQGTAIVRHVRYNYRNDATASRDGPQEYLRTLHGCRPTSDGGRAGIGLTQRLIFAKKLHRRAQ